MSAVPDARAVPDAGAVPGARLLSPVRTGARRILAVTAFLAAAVPAFVAVLVAVVTAPITAAAGRPWRLLRFSVFVLVYICVDLAGVAGGCWAWVCCLRPVPGASRQERLRSRSHDSVARLLDRICGAAERIFALRLRIVPPVPPPDRVAAATLLVLARHAGPGDSFLLVRALMREAGLRPALVLKRALRWDPCLDVLVGRIPHVFVPPRAQDGTVDAIAALGAALGPGEAAVIFPEGGKFTRARRARAISWLRRHGETRRAARARRRSHVLPPRPDGTLALLGGAPTADVVIVAHSGLDGMDSASRIWAGVPLREPVTARWWRARRSAIPTERDAASDWLDRQWSLVDAWIEAQTGPGTLK